MRDAGAHLAGADHADGAEVIRTEFMGHRRRSPNANV
jgi:hypothetical protein